MQEEQRRTLVSLRKWAARWDERTTTPERNVECVVLKQGLDAYAAKQATQHRLLATKYQAIWTAPAGSAVVEASDEGQEADEREAVGSAGTTGVEQPNGDKADEYIPQPIYELNDDSTGRTLDYDSDVE